MTVAPSVPAALSPEGPERAAAVAARHLRACGCSVRDGAGGARDATRPGVSLLVSDPGGVAGEVACVVDWSGPLDPAVGVEDELTAQAACGVMHVHGRRRGDPEALALDYVSTAAGLLLAIGALAALVGRRRGLPVRTVHTSGAQAALLAVSQYLAAATCDDREHVERLLPGGPPFVARDGLAFELETFDPSAWMAFWRAAGADEGAARRGWRSFEQRFATATCPLDGALAAAAGRHRLAELASLAAPAGIGLVALADARTGRDHRRAAGVSGGAPWTIDVLAAGHPPRAATDARNVADGTATWGGARARGARFTAPPGVRDRAAGPLDGIVVIEAARRVQGPLAGHVLSLLGARVVHVEAPGGDPLRGAPPMAGGVSARFQALNHAKQRVEVDIRTAAGRATVRELVAGADAFVHNWAPGKAAELGLDAAELAAVRPSLVYAQASAWGPRLGAGPAIGTDFVVQAFSGLAAALRAPAATSLMTLTDVLGGLVCAEGVLAGLLATLDDGRGRRVESSLLSAAAVALDAGPPGASSALHAPLRTADGWLVLPSRAVARPARVGHALRAAPGAPGDEAAAIRAALGQATTEAALERLAAAGLGGARVCTDLAALAAEPAFAGALDTGACALVAAPWELGDERP